ncbi:ADP-heptose:LPS heptosyltransferase [Lutibacter sp. Hel_I_33_5]|uniref:glycosyltransferase family 9 protein n=1 Tax=Lutibacter sp. Hel_I_33_5 TaxID=1566289 RepID=UPI0011ADF9AF|nr:glycosyltransferase family 9 protein [Lutibacter sp. Hel_I_33_5]TVZ56267.1 ADP-heptose:LPS heptosyltransferase [Lutibacter sp. Hel_I_33_5]
METNNKHILVIRLSAMGDVAMSVPVIRALAEQHSDTKITILSKPFLKPLFNNINNVNFVSAEVEGKHKGIFGLFKLYKELKKSNITHIADLHNVLRSKIIRSLFKFSKTSIAFIDKGRVEKKALTRINNKVFKQLKTSHQRYADVFEKLGFTVDITKSIKIIKPKLNSNILKTTGEKSQTWIGIAPFAAFASKTYPLDLLEKVISELCKNKYQLILFGGKNDVLVLEKIAEKYNNIISVASKLGGLENEINLISNLDVMLSMDSGNAHFAAMQNVKTVTIWGITHPFAGFSPFNQSKDYCILPDLEKYPNIPCSIYGNKVCKGYEDVMRSIPPEKIIKKIISII